MEDGRITCKQCNGKGEYRVRFYYKDKQYYYFSKCGVCFTKGYLDWIEYARGRKFGISGFYIDTHPAGSLIIDPEEFGGCRIYDGHNYINKGTKRGEALWNYLLIEKEG